MTAKNIPSVSIGMPVYNAERYIRNAIDSLLAQTYTDFELIISDNASTDKTEIICRDYAMRDIRVRYIRQPINQGAIANFHFVLSESQGEYFMWACYDDSWGKQWLHAGVHALQFNLNVVGAFGFVKYISRVTNVLAAIDCPPYNLHGDKTERVKRYISINYPDHLFYSLVRREWVVKTYFYKAIQNRREYLVCPEKYFILEAILDGGFADVPEMECEINFLLKNKEDLMAMGLKVDAYSNLKMLIKLCLLIFKRNTVHQGIVLSFFFIAYRFPIIHNIFNIKVIQYKNRKLFVETSI